MGEIVADVSLPWLGSFSWWWVGLFLTCAVGYSVPFLLAAYVGAGLGCDLMLFGLVGGGPVLGTVFGSTLLGLADPEPGCTEECYGRFVVMLLAAHGVILWEAGVAIGCLVRYLKGRRMRCAA